MPKHTTSREVDRTLTDEERLLIEWLLKNGNEEASSLLSQLPEARVVGLCACGCASIDLAVGGRRGSIKNGMHVVSDFCWRSSEGFLFGAFVFTSEGLLGGLDLWSIDGQATPTVLPRPEQLRPYGTQA